MLDQLPAEILLHIVRYLPTASSILSVSRTNKKLHHIIENDSSAIFQHFVQKFFPTIPAQAPWVKAAYDLTTRSRAFERRAFIARECAPPEESTHRYGPHERRWYANCAPVVDSYETVSTDGADRKEALAMSIAGRMWLRIIHGKSVIWETFRVTDDDESWNDIFDIRLLRPHQNRHPNETALIRRANNQISLVHYSTRPDGFTVLSEYNSGLIETHCIDVSDSVDPKLAVCNSESLRLFPVHSSLTMVRPDVQFEFAPQQSRQRARTVKFLGEKKIAVGMQFLEGISSAPVQVFDLEASQMSSHLETFMDFSTLVDQGHRNHANVLASVNDSCISSNVSENLLVAGCADGLVRLYDLREGSSPVQKYTDPVDDGQILSLVVIGQEKFFAGSHQNACLKMFDMRMNKAVYHHAPKNRPLIPGARKNRSASPHQESGLKSRRDINIFLAVGVYPSQQLWRPLPTVDSNRLVRYRGSVYSLSTPSPTSRTIFAGIENHVLQLDFVNTDDYVLNRADIHRTLGSRRVLNFSCYERPRPGFESTDPILLRVQRPWIQARSKLVDTEPGWDERWHLEGPRKGFRFRQAK